MSVVYLLVVAAVFFWAGYERGRYVQNEAISEDLDTLAKLIEDSLK